MDRFPTTWEELGEDLHRLRGLRSLEGVATHLNWSKSALQRWEKGHPVPPAAARELDNYYRTDGWLAHAVVRLSIAGWNPWQEETAARTHAHRWPAKFDGLVWFQVRPTSDNVDQPHELIITWGPWRREVRAVMPAKGIIWSTQKEEDTSGVAVVCRFKADRPVFVRYGAGDIDDDLHVDIAVGWYRID